MNTKCGFQFCVDLFDNVCMYIDNMINCQSIYMVVLSIIYTQKHHDQSLCV